MKTNVTNSLSDSLEDLENDMFAIVTDAIKNALITRDCSLQAMAIFHSDWTVEKWVVFDPDLIRVTSHSDWNDAQEATQNRRVLFSDERTVGSEIRYTYVFYQTPEEVEAA